MIIPVLQARHLVLIQPVVQALSAQISGLLFYIRPCTSLPWVGLKEELWEASQEESEAWPSTAHTHITDSGPWLPGRLCKHRSGGLFLLLWCEFWALAPNVLQVLHCAECYGPSGLLLTVLRSSFPLKCSSHRAPLHEGAMNQEHISGSLEPM